jgi:hypothetical protein
MRRLSAAWILLLVTALPAVALANPNTESPEPSFWAFAALGAVPIFYVAWRSLRADAAAAPAPVRIEGE